MNAEDQIDLEFIQRVAAEVTQSCALPIAVHAERIPEYILQAAQWFWLNDDFCAEERYYLIPNREICKSNVFNKTIQLPQQILGVHGVYKAQQGLTYGVMGDFSIERMMLSTYSMFGGVGAVGQGGNMAGSPYASGYNLTDVIASMYEVSTFNQYLNAPLTYNFNPVSHKLVLLGNMGYSDILICTMKRCRIQDLYNYHYFFRYVVCLVKRALSSIYGTFEFKLPGGVTINYDSFREAANDELDKIEEWVEKNRACDYFFQPNTL